MSAEHPPLFRTSQLSEFRTLAAALRQLNDDQLRQVRLELLSLVQNEPVVPIMQALSALTDVAVEEVNHRLAEDWNTDASSHGGHKLFVASDLTALDTFQAVCAPAWDDEECWVGPVRSTHEEAAEDGRLHHPGVA